MKCFWNKQKKKTKKTQGIIFYFFKYLICSFVGDESKTSGCLERDFRIFQIFFRNHSNSIIQEGLERLSSLFILFFMLFYLKKNQISFLSTCFLFFLFCYTWSGSFAYDDRPGLILWSSSSLTSFTSRVKGLLSVLIN